ncbi:hypothetical protein Bca52824_003708 [Brassica carinata]|uniref:Reverse transcriptase zinc-binding domain-containing protein n=1 Tax=Brassica carinata TaxID=52824 RepID=A0A8X8BFH3_BRACI|nr:hypothetical protein Bca52824_003708 [Brassica carinata]
MSPKLKFFIWKAAKESLPTGANLQHRGVSQATNCVHCNGHETTLHALFLCIFAQRVWSLGPWNEQLDCSNSLSFQNLLVESQTKRNLPSLGVSINLLPWLCWSIWYSRNQLLFQNKSPSPRDTFNRAICLAKEWENAQFPPNSRTPNRLPPVQITSQSNNAIRCNTDAVEI